VQIISLFNQLQYTRYKCLLSNTHNDLKGCHRNTPYREHKN